MSREGRGFPGVATPAAKTRLPGMRLRVLVADDHPILLAGVKAALGAEPDLEVVGEQSDGPGALQGILDTRPDVAVLDVDMPLMSGIEVARKLADRSAPTAIVVLSMHPEQAFVRAALEAGVCGYVVKQDAAHDLVQAIRAAALGQVFVSARVALPASGNRGGERPHLSPRERDVVRLIAQGLSSKQIAFELGLTPKTVEGYRSAIMEKLDIHSVAGLVKYAIREHLGAADD
jgi:DNA-binding NarL/FixJ family response regulator